MTACRKNDNEPSGCIKCG